MQETNLTLVAAYLAYIVSEFPELHFSGGVAVVTLGLIMSAFGKTVISSEAEHYLHEFWEMIGRNLEIIIFVLGGMLVALEFSSDESNGEASDILNGFILYLCLHVIRFIVVMAHFPILRFLGYGISFKEALVLVAMAFKGALSLTLGLTIFNDDELN
jgi:NhaP-type Na+/H+ or K+/H+ antiporter